MNVEIKDITITKSVLVGTELIEMQEAAGGVNSSLKVTVSSVADYIHKYKVGFADYNDLNTATTPVSHSGSGGFIKLTNDGAGAFTNITYLPTGITSLWDTTNSQFNFTQLALGDQVEVRIDLEVTTTANNQDVNIQFYIAVGGSPYPLAIHSMSPKSSGTYSVVRYLGFYMGDTNTLNNPAEVQIDSDAACTAKINGWYINVTRR